MCGIAGVLRIHEPGTTPPPHLEVIPEAWLDVLDESIKHRGPDGQGRFRDRAVRPDGTVVDVALVHRRLSIIDHAGGHQPMVHDGERLRPDLTYQPGEAPRIASEIEPDKALVAVVFNGCIYNHRELRTELEAVGHRFETDHSDTEVLVHGWRAWGLRMQEELDGMYALLAWDRMTGQLGWGRDLAGEKPLEELWPFDGTSQSHIKEIAFCSSPAGPINLDLASMPWSESICEFITRGCDDSACVMAAGHSRPGEWEVRPRSPLRGAKSRTRGTVPRRRYQRPTRGERHPSQFREDTPSNKTLIERAVTSRLEADVPIGVFLSGGIDSGLIAAIAKQHRPDIRAFTVRMPEASFDESEDAAETANAIGIDHTILDCQPNPANDLVHLIHQLGLPFGDSSLLPTYWVSKAAREHVKVALSGDGADELFGGYRRHAINPVLNRYRWLLKLIPDRLLDRRAPGTRSEYLARLALAARQEGYTELLAIFQTPDLRRLIKSVDGEAIEAARFRPVDDPLRHDFEHYLPDDLLRKTDTASMAVGLEVRAPFLARELVEAALRTPLAVLMPGGERKGLLEQVARKYLPDHIVDRPKRGFAIPIGQWFRSDYGGMRTLLYDHLESADPFPGLAQAGVEINTGFVQQMLREHDRAGEASIWPWHGRDHSQRLYMLAVLSIWAKWLAGLDAEGSGGASKLRDE